MRASMQPSQQTITKTNCSWKVEEISADHLVETLCSERSQLVQVAQRHVQQRFALQGLRLHNLSGQSAPLFNLSHSKKKKLFFFSHPHLVALKQFHSGDLISLYCTRLFSSMCSSKFHNIHADISPLSLTTPAVLPETYADSGED